MACCERAGSDGRELIVGLVLGHEFEMRLCEAAFPGIRERGWHHATLTAFVSPIVAGRMLRLTPQQIQHAIGISASARATLGAVTAGKLTMMKNTVDPMATQSGVLAALLAEKGYTGPEHVIDGKEGLVHCFGPEWKLNLLTDGLGESWRITQCGMKAFPTEALTHTPISAVLALVKDNDLKPQRHRRGTHPYDRARRRHPERSQQVRSAYQRDGGPLAALRDRGGYRRAAGHATAVHAGEDHGPDDSRTTQQDQSWLLTRRSRKCFPRLQRVIVTHSHDRWPRVHTQLDYPKGDPRNPLTDKEVEEKFEALAEPVMSHEARRRAIEAIWNLEKQTSVTELMKLFSADRELRRTIAWGRPWSRRSRRRTWPRARSGRCVPETSSPSGLPRDDARQHLGGDEEVQGHGSRAGARSRAACVHRRSRHPEHRRVEPRQVSQHGGIRARAGHRLLSAGHRHRPPDHGGEGLRAAGHDSSSPPIRTPTCMAHWARSARRWCAPTPLQSGRRGEFWWQIPRTIQVVLEGKLRAGVTGKDVIITLCGLYNHEEVLNAAVEFAGPGVASLSMDARLQHRQHDDRVGRAGGLVSGG